MGPKSNTVKSAILIGALSALMTINEQRPRGTVS